jgi:hypothetical protein
MRSILGANSTKVQGESTMKTSWTVGSRMVVAVAALACQALPIQVSAQGQVFGSDQCQFLPALAGATVQRRRCDGA